LGGVKAEKRNEKNCVLRDAE